MTCFARNCIWSILRAKLVSRFGSLWRAGYTVLNTRSASCGMRASFLSASIRKDARSSGIAFTIPSRMAESMGPSHPSPSIRFTLSAQFGFSMHRDHRDRLYSAPSVLCPWASLRDHFPPTRIRIPRRRTANILLGIPSIPPMRSPHSLSALIIAMRGFIMMQ